MFLAGRAQVDVRVDEAGKEMAAAGVDELGAARRGQRAGCAVLGDDAVADQHVERRIDRRARVEDPGAADQQGRGLPRLAVQPTHASCGSVGAASRWAAGSPPRAPASSS